MKLQTFIGYKTRIADREIWKQDLKKHHVPQHLQLHYPSSIECQHQYVDQPAAGGLNIRLSVTGRCEKVVGVGDA